MSTYTHSALGGVVDAEPPGWCDLHTDWERSHVEPCLSIAEAEGVSDLAKELTWELGILDLRLAPAEEWRHSFESDTSYEQRWAMSEAASLAVLEYARARAAETANPALRVRYLEFLLWRSHVGAGGGGATRGQLHRRLVQAYRAFIEHALARLNVPVTADERRRQVGGATAVGLVISDAVQRAGFLVRHRGALRAREECVDWAQWVLSVAKRLEQHDWPTDDQDPPEFWRHRYPFEVLAHLACVSAEVVDMPLRSEAMELLTRAASYFDADPLAETFSQGIAAVEADLLAHWGDADAEAVRHHRILDASVRAAMFHRTHGSGMVAAQFFQKALEYAVGAPRDTFTDPEVAGLRASMREAIEHGASSNELVAQRIHFELPAKDFDMTQSTAEETVVLMLDSALQRLPDLAEVEQGVIDDMQRFPLEYVFPRVMLGPGKVVDEAHSEAERRASAMLERVVLHARLVGGRNDVTLRSAVDKVGLTPEHLVSAVMTLGPMVVDEGTAGLLGVGYERYLAGDLVSAVHVLVPRVEDVVRRFLRARGIEDTEFKTGLGPDRTATRTDDATFGAFLRRNTADGRAARDILTPPLFAFLEATTTSPTGMNLRNNVAHGLIRPAHCTGEAVGVVTHIFLSLAALAKAENRLLEKESEPDP